MTHQNAQEYCSECSAPIPSSSSPLQCCLFSSSSYDPPASPSSSSSSSQCHLNLIQQSKHLTFDKYLIIPTANMLQQQQDLLENMPLIVKNQSALLKMPQNPQQQFFHLYAHRYLLKEKLKHETIQAGVEYLPGTFSNLALNHQYMTFCIQNKIELSAEDYPLIEKLIRWTEEYPSLNTKSSLSFMKIVFQDGSYDVFQSIYSLITYIDIITPDILKLIRKKGRISSQSQDKGKDKGKEKEKEQKEKEQKAQHYNLSMLAVDDLLTFVNVSMPKILFNLILDSNLMPGQKKKDDLKNFQCLYKVSSLQFYVKTKTNYSSLIRTFIKILLHLELKPAQQKRLMEIVINYFYAFHNDKKSHSTDYFIEAFNKLDQSTRFALSDQFLLFFRIAKKVGKGKFLNFLLQKSSLFKQINTKIADNHLVGYPKDSLIPFNAYHIIGESLVVNNGQKQYRYFEILQEFSLFYYKIGIKSQDITVRLYYLGDFNERSLQIKLLQNQKQSGQLLSSVLAVKKGLYMFQFDNSYSWINKKIIRYQNIVFSPLQVKAHDPIKWISSFYQNVQGNQAIKDSIIMLPKSNKKSQDKKYEGTCNISKNGPFFNLKLKKGNKIYEFQSQSQQKIIKKFNQLLQSQKNIKWLVDQQPLDTDATVLEKIKGYQNQKSAKNPSESAGNNKKVQKIEQRYSQAEQIDVQGSRQNQGVIKKQ